MSDQAPTPGQSKLVTKLLEDAHGALTGLHHLVRHRFGLREQAQERALDECVSLQALVAGASGLGEDGVRPAEIAADSLDDANVRDQVDPAQDRPEPAARRPARSGSRLPGGPSA